MRWGRVDRSRWAVVVLTLALLTTPTAARAHVPPSPETYRWVNAPADMFSGGFSSAWTPDGQASVLLTVPEGAIPSTTEVTLQPLDANSLAHAPADFAPNGNAYRISVGTEGWRPHARVQLTTPYPATGMWIHDVETGWRSVTDQVLDSGEVLAEIQPTADGVVVVAAWIPPSHAWWQQLTHSPRNMAVALVVAGGAGWTIGNRRSRRARQATMTA